MKPIGIAALMFGLSVGGSVAIASTWKGTIGEPLRDSTAEAIQLADHLRSIGAKFYGAWTCPACFRQMNLFGKESRCRCSLHRVPQAEATPRTSLCLHNSKDPRVSHLGDARRITSGRHPIVGRTHQMERTSLKCR